MKNYQITTLTLALILSACGGATEVQPEGLGGAPPYDPGVYVPAGTCIEVETDDGATLELRGGEEAETIPVPGAVAWRVCPDLCPEPLSFCQRGVLMTEVLDESCSRQGFTLRECECVEAEPGEAECSEVADLGGIGGAR